MTNLDNILKSRDITLPTKVCIVKAMVFPVVMYRCVFVSVTHSCPTLVTPQTVARQAPVSMEFSRQEYCSGLPFATTGGDVGSIPGSGRSPGGGNGNPLQYFCLENPMERGAWRTMVHRVTKESDRTQ